MQLNPNRGTRAEETELISDKCSCHIASISNV